MAQARTPSQLDQDAGADVRCTRCLRSRARDAFVTASGKTRKTCYQCREQDRCAKQISRADAHCQPHQDPNDAVPNARRGTDEELVNEEQESQAHTKQQSGWSWGRLTVQEEDTDKEWKEGMEKHQSGETKP
ncbi:hypothetical protein LTR78_009484 [Recurvomyces mirabilis]|uniref:Uncharacterized protein n=1 Tax=Recurvomyces mirabilis TaxID=574656 RepID=A0AAE0TNQ3_9PEZI|nr:hypothetical protein LTR78_009484 [Recurvomyces mirabilis]